MPILAWTHSLLSHNLSPPAAYKFLLDLEYSGLCLGQLGTGLRPKVLEKIGCVAWVRPEASEASGEDMKSLIQLCSEDVGCMMGI